MSQGKEPWLSVYEGKLSERPIEGSLTAFLEEAVDKHRDNVALTQGESPITYGELLELTEKMAAALSEAGVKKGDRVGLMLPNCPEYVIGFFGAMRMGATATQVNPIYVGRELEHIFDNSGSETVIMHEMMYEKVTIVPSTNS
jgi:long-chain acyl-CoA synthetase